MSLLFLQRWILILFLILAPLKVQNLAYTKGFYSFTDAQYTRDGSQLIFSGDMDSIENPDRSLESEIYCR
jgi:hypothetical protein